MLDELVGVIETLQSRIQTYRDILSRNETRTRMALIDPLLSALGWEVADPGLVTPEYDISGQRADYALLSGQGHKPIALLEAKRLGEPLDPTRHQEQVFTYALMQQVRYAGLTDGDLWALDNVADFSGGERRILEVSIANEPAHRCALKLLLLWRPNLASEQPVEAKEPIAGNEVRPPPTPDGYTRLSTVPGVTAVPPPLPDGYTPLTELQDVRNQPPPSAILLPDGTERGLKFWKDILLEVAEYLARTKKLTQHNCPVPASRGSKKYIVHQEAVHLDGKEFRQSRTLSNGLICETDNSGERLIKDARFLLDHVGENAAAVRLKLR